jgi:hypothetical protein
LSLDQETVLAYLIVTLLGAVTFEAFRLALAVELLQNKTKIQHNKWL